MTLCRKHLPGRTIAAPAGAAPAAGTFSSAAMLAYWQLLWQKSAAFNMLP
jgi:hypothetical protein